MNDFRPVFIRELKRPDTDNLPSIAVGFVAATRYIEKHCFYDPSEADGMAQQVWMAGMEAAQDIALMCGLEAFAISRLGVWDIKKAAQAVEEFTRG